MGVIKGHHASALLQEAIVLDLGDLARQAQRLQADSRAKAQAILAEARAQAKQMTDAAHGQGFDRGRQEGYAQGLEDGRNAGHAEALQQTRQQLEQLQRGWLEAIERWEQDRATMVREARQAVLQLAVLAAQKLVHRVVAVDPSVIVDQVAAALAHVLRPLAVKVRVHPDDQAILAEAMPALLQRLPHLEHVELVQDTTVDRGGCIVTHGQGCIDATIGKQLQRLVQTLLPEGLPAAEASAAATTGDGSAAGDPATASTDQPEAGTELANPEDGGPEEDPKTKPQ